jgi:hypothetical protein
MITNSKALVTLRTPRARRVHPHVRDARQPRCPGRARAILGVHDLLRARQPQPGARAHANRKANS